MFSDEEDEDYVPESLRNFLEDANNQLERDLEDIMKFEKHDTDYMEPCEPKDVPDPDAYDHETTSTDKEEDKQFFEQIMAKERDQNLKSELMAGIGYPAEGANTAGHNNNNNDMEPPSLVDESSSMDDFMSPSMSDLTSSTKNPAADLTASTAKRMAMEGMSSPQGVNLQAEFDKAQHNQQTQAPQNRLQPVAEGGVVEDGASSSSPLPPTVASSWMATIQSLDDQQETPVRTGSESLTTQSDLSLAYSSTTTTVLDGTRDATRNVGMTAAPSTSVDQQQNPDVVKPMIVDEESKEIYVKSGDVKAKAKHPNIPAQSPSNNGDRHRKDKISQMPTNDASLVQPPSPFHQPQKQRVEVEQSATTPMELVDTSPPQQPPPTKVRPSDQTPQQQQKRPPLSDAVKQWGKAPDSPVRPTVAVARSSPPPPPSHTTGKGVAAGPSARTLPNPPTIRAIPAEKGMTESEDATAMSIEHHPKVLAKIKPSPPRQRPSPPRQKPPPPPPPRPQSKDKSQKIVPRQKTAPPRLKARQQGAVAKSRTSGPPPAPAPAPRGAKMVRKAPTPRFSPPRTRTRNKSPAPVAPSAPPPTHRDKQTRKAPTPRFSTRARAPPKDRGSVQSRRPKPHVAPTPEKLNRPQEYVDRPRDIIVVQQTPPKPPVPPTDSIPAIIHADRERNSIAPDVEAALSNDSSAVEKMILVDLDELAGAAPASTKPKPSVPVDTRGRRELTTPEKIPSRLLQGTSASLARTAKEKEPTSGTNSLSGSIKRAKRSSPLPSRLLQGTESSLVHQALSPTKHTKAAESDREATKLRVRERVEEQKRKQAERDKAMRERIKMRQKQQKERKHKMQEVLNRARGKRERLEQLERERVEKIKLKLAEKEKKAAQRMSLEKENLSAKSTSTQTQSQSHARRIRKVTPTIPIAPSFATDRRMKRKPTSESSGGPPLARSGDILMQGLRASSPSPDIRRASSGSSGPTIPRGPRLSTSTRHGEKHIALPIREANETPTWERGLRNVSSPTPSERSSNHSLTIPKTPKFHETHKRQRPKSTAEKEKEMIDYYKAHPFKARPVRMNDLSPAPRPTKVDAPRPLTRPAPFHFHIDDRIGGKSREEPKGKKEETVVFKARPMPNFSSVRNTPLSGKSPPPTRPTTSPSPFHFHTDDRIGKSIEEPEKKKDENGLFKARPMPNFSSVRDTPLTGKVSPSKKHLTTPEPFKLRTGERASSVSPSKASKSTEGGTGGTFRARPMPNFGKSNPVVNQRNPSRKTPPQEPKETYQFKARPMPDFCSSGPPSTISFNVTTSHDSAEDGLDDHGSQFQFHARPMPSFDKVDIPVVQRNPEKTRSPNSRVHQEDRNEPEFKPFRARQVPNFSKPSIPVKPRSPSSGSRNGPSQRLVSPPHARSSPSSLKRDRPQSPKFHARPAPKFSRPSILVKQKDPSKLRSPDTIKKVGDTGMVIRAGRRLQHGGHSVSTAGSASAARSLTADERAAIRVAKKRQTKERIRERMMGNNKAISAADALKDEVKEILYEAKDAVKSQPIATGTRNSMVSGTESNSAYEYSTSTSGAVTTEMTTRETVNRKARLSTLSSTEDSTMENTDTVRSPVRPPAMSRVTQSSSASTGTEAILQNWSLMNPSASTSEGTFGVPSGTASGVTNDSLRLATDLWPSSSNDMTPVHSAARARNPQLFHQEQVHGEEEDEELLRYQEAVKLAYSVQKQADDELSFHGSISSKEQGSNIGQIESIL